MSDKGRMTEKRAIEAIRAAYSEQISSLNERADACLSPIDAELHRQSAGTIQALLIAYSAALGDHSNG